MLEWLTEYGSDDSPQDHLVYNSFINGTHGWRIVHLHNQPTKNHFPNATFFEVSKVR